MAGENGAGARRPLGDGSGAGAPLTLIYLDVDDEITSAAARIRGAGADEVALVLPFGSRLATSRINFRLLAREAAGRAKRIEVITADASARSLAAAAGLAVHPSVAAFEAHRSGVDPEAGDGGGSGATGPGSTGARAGTSSPDDAPGQGRRGAATAAGAATATGAASAADAASRTGEQLPLPSPDLEDTKTRVLAGPRRTSPRVPLVGPPRHPVRPRVALAAGLAVILAVVAGGLLALEFLPSASITLHPRSEAIGPIDLLVEAREDVSAPDPATMTIPAQRFTFALGADDTFPATGVRVDETKATGQVTFSNFDTGRGVLVPAGTVVQTEDDVEFVTLQEVTLPRAQIDFFPPFPVRPSTATVGIEAALPGPAGNVGNNTIVDVARGGRNLLVTNEQATSGGARNETTVVSAADVDAARDLLLGGLQDDLDAAVAAREGIPEGVTIFELTAAAGEPQWSVDPETLVGTGVEEFQLGATAEGSVLGVDPGPIQGLAEAQLASRVDEGWSIQQGSIQVAVGLPTEVSGTVTYPVEVRATQVRDVDVEGLIAAVRGLGLPEARALLDDYGDVTLVVSPDWVTKIPTREGRVTLQLGAPQPSAAP